MAITDVLVEIEAAAQRTREKRDAYEYAAAKHQAATEDARVKLESETHAANEERDRCVQDAQATFDATVKQTDDERVRAGQELEAARAELDKLRAQANEVLGDLLGESNARVRVSQ